MTVLLAATPLCGACALADVIRPTEQLGLPFDYAAPENLTRWSTELGTPTPEATLTELSQRRQSENGVFGILAKYDHGMGFNTARQMLRLLPNVKSIHIRRVDVLRQAVAFALSKQTVLWDNAGDEPARYDPGLIDHCLNDIVVQNALWTRLFQRLGITPLELTFEDVAQDPRQAVARIASHCDLPDIPLQSVPARVSDSADDRIEDWVTRYADDRLARKAILRELDDLARGDWRHRGADD